MTEFLIHHVDRSRAQSVEPLGSKPKFWFREGDRHLLFKADDRGTGEDWAEVIACRLCGLLGLPHVEYELAVEMDGSQYLRPGVVCENMVRGPAMLVLGNELLLASDPQYPREQRFRVRQHTVDAVHAVVAQLAPPPEHWMATIPAGVESALGVFVGYVMLDAWIANQDRHHENWGALRFGRREHLAPTFDHGAALARNLSDEERAERMTTKDRNHAVAAFTRRGRSALYRSPDDVRALQLDVAFREFADRAPAAGKAWLDRLNSIKRDVVKQIPAPRMTETCKRFTMELLETNRQRLLK